MKPTVDHIEKYLNHLTPFELAEEWDNVGLLVGDPQSPVEKIMTCLTITPESAAEAIRSQADMVISHHPLPFRALKRLTTNETSGRLLLQLIRAGIAVLSPHTAFDSAREGINAQLAERFQLHHVVPLVPSDHLGENVGAARVGTTQSGATLQSLIDQAKESLDLDYVRWVGDSHQTVTQVALCCGSGGSFLDHVIRAGCDAMVTGEATFHVCLEAKARSIALLLVGHYHSERFAVEFLANAIRERFPELEVWPSEDESDPIRCG